MSATRAGDIATVLSLMTDDVVFLVAGQQPFGKRAIRRGHEAAAGRHADAEDRRPQRNPGNPGLRRPRLHVDRLSVEMTLPGGER